MSQKIRYEWVDALKFLGICAIYLGHFGPNAGKLYPFVFSYHVPLFFFASGFFSSRKKSESIFKFTISKARRLLLPYFSFAILILIMTSVSSGENVSQLFSHLVDIFYGVRNNPYVGPIWFINCLFVASVLDEILRRLLRNDMLTLIFSVASLMYTQTFLSHNPLLNPSWFWNIDSALAYWWLLALGRVIFKWVSSDALSFHSVKGYLIFSVCTMFAAYQLYSGQSILIPISSYIKVNNFILFGTLNIIISTSALIFFNIFIAKMICSSRFVIDAGRNTLNICGLENITKTLLPSAISVFGLSISLPSPLAAIVYTMICIYISQKIGLWLAENISGPFSIK